MTSISEIRKQAWETRRKKYGAHGHNGRYSRKPCPDCARMRDFIARLHVEGILSEGQAAAEADYQARLTGRLIESDPDTLRGYCQQLLDLIENYGVEVEGEDNDLVALISRSVDPAHVDAEGRNDG